MMELTYEITRNDFMQFNIYHMEKAPTYSRALLVSRFLVGLFLGLYLLYWQPKPLWPAALFFAFISIGWFLYAPLTIRKSVSRRIARMLDEGVAKDIFGEISLILEENSIHETAHSRQTEYAYTDLERVANNGGSFYIYNGSAVVLIIPAHVFTTPEDGQAFLQVLKEKNPALILL